MKEMIFLGAGASVEAGVPVASAMTLQLDGYLADWDELYTNDPKRRLTRLSRFVSKTLAKSATNLQKSVDVEQFFTAIRALSERKGSELGAFVTAWRPLVGQIEIDVPSNNGSNPYKEMLNSILLILIDMVWIKEPTVEKPSRLGYLKPLIDLYRNQGDLVIASLNYDNAIESLAKENGVPCATGLSTWSATGDIPSPSKDILLLKLHGSVDWGFRWNDAQDTDHPMRDQDFKQVTTAGEFRKGYEPMMIFGKGNKLTAQGPFLDLLKAFERELNASDRLTVAGYSFRDDHINEYISIDV